MSLARSSGKAKKMMMRTAIARVWLLVALFAVLVVSRIVPDSSGAWAKVPWSR